MVEIDGLMSAWTEKMDVGPCASRYHGDALCHDTVGGKFCDFVRLSFAFVFAPIDFSHRRDEIDPRGQRNKTQEENEGCLNEHWTLCCTKRYSKELSLP